MTIDWLNFREHCHVLALLFSDVAARVRSLYSVFARRSDRPHACRSFWFGVASTCGGWQADVVDGLRFDVNFGACLSCYCHVMLTDLFFGSAIFRQFEKKCCVFSLIVTDSFKPKFHLARHVTTRSTCRAHAFWLCRACRTARLDTLDSTRSTRDLTSQVEFGLN